VAKLRLAAGHPWHQLLGQPIPEAQGTTAVGTVAPHHVWEKSPGLSGMAFYDGDRFKAWQHNAFIGALVTQELIRLQFDGDRVVHEERLLGELNNAFAMCARGRMATCTC
jgi:glucose/arabinose dehydrogenase